jgi:hypothetical protein
MGSTRLLLVAVLAGVLSSEAVGAADSGAADASQAQPGVLLDAIRANRKALVAASLEVGAEEAGKFWPLYDRYQKEIQAIGEREAAIVEDYTASFRDLSDEKALKLMEDYLAAEAERLKVRRAYLGEFAKILPGRTVARLYQIENKMDAVLRYDLAATIPVVDERP